jgi:hypothetical protein
MRRALKPAATAKMTPYSGNDAGLLPPGPGISESWTKTATTPPKINRTPLAYIAALTAPDIGARIVV